MILARGRQCHCSPSNQPVSRLLPRQQHPLQIIHRRQFHKTLVMDQQTETTDFIVVKCITQYR